MTVKQAIQRMARVLLHWRKIDHVDREYLLRRFRDDYPQEFWKIATERAGQKQEEM